MKRFKGVIVAILCIIFTIAFTACDKDKTHDWWTGEKANTNIECGDYSFSVQYTEQCRSDYKNYGVIILKNNRVQHTNVIIQFAYIDFRDWLIFSEDIPTFSNSIMRVTSYYENNVEHIREENIIGDTIELTPYEEVELKFSVYYEPEGRVAYTFNADPDTDYVYCGGKGLWLYLRIENNVHKILLADTSQLLLKSEFEKDKDYYLQKGGHWEDYQHV